MRLLSVDWDFFFPELSFDPEKWMLYDWGHRDGGSLFLNQLWYDRAAGFLINDMPLPGTTGEETTFWDRFKFRPHSKLFFADSHVEIYNPEIQVLFQQSGLHRIDNYDAHHDAGYRGTRKSFIEEAKVSCENWALAYDFHGIPTRMFYPTWKTNAMEIETKPVYNLKRVFDPKKVVNTPYDHVFICRSGGWSPAWLDDQFEAFLTACPIQSRQELGACPNRNWSASVLDEHVKISQQVRAMVPTQPLLIQVNTTT